MDELDKPAAEAGGDPSEHNGNAHGGAPSHAAPAAHELSAERDADEITAEAQVAAGLVPGAAEPDSPAMRLEDDEPADEIEPSDQEAAEEEEAIDEPVTAAAEEPQELPPVKLDWYILKVQSNREDSIADALQRRIKIAGLDRFFDQVIVPIEKVSEFKNGKKRVVKRKLYPGYLVVHMELNDDTWFLVRETPGIGDFTGSGGKPTPMLPHEVNKIVAKQDEKTEEQAVIDVKFKPGDRVRINEGTFENFEGDVDNIDMANGRVTVMINIFGRSTPVELEYWQVEGV
ncbi:MAG TPA: transcription termination/antitermination protein NusG [Pirellulales bacterium]|nr:transcription termination/antitermination protein NusG [Pirellulales bacterium]